MLIKGPAPLRRRNRAIFMARDANKIPQIVRENPAPQKPARYYGHTQ
jgi:hypothetical protein